MASTIDTNEKIVEKNATQNKDGTTTNDESATSQSPSKSKSSSSVLIKRANEMPSSQKNWLLHLHYVRGEIELCKSIIQDQLAETGGFSEYPTYCLAMILRQEGKIQQSLELFQKCVIMNPQNPENLKQVALSMHLQGRHKASIDVYNEVLNICPDDWEVFHNIGTCYMHLKEYEKCKEYLTKALIMSHHEMSYILLGKVNMLMDNINGAIDLYNKAAKAFPENPDILSSLGLLLLQVGDFKCAFENLGNAMTYDPKHMKSILLAGSMMQSHNDYEAAIAKYRTALTDMPENAPLWNNIGMSFFGKKKYVAAVSCLKRAHYLAPFDWKVSYNLGLVHLVKQQHASAFHFLRSAIRWNPSLAEAFHLLAVTLTRLNDDENAKKSYEHALSLKDNDPCIDLNYAICLFNLGDKKSAKIHLSNYHRKINLLRESGEKINHELLETVKDLEIQIQS